MKSCIFCQIVAKKAPADIVYEDDKYMAFLDKYPQSIGHLQLVPKKHWQWIYDLPEIGEFFELAQKIIHVIIPVLGASSVRLATFGDEVKHAHLWIVPQYQTEIHLAQGQSQRFELEKHLINKLKIALKEEVQMKYGGGQSTTG